MAEIARKYPHTRFIAAHFGGWSEWEKAEHELVGLDNIWVDTSSSFYAMTPEKAAELITRFGCDRVFFGTKAAYLNEFPQAWQKGGGA